MYIDNQGAINLRNLEHLDYIKHIAVHDLFCNIGDNDIHYFDMNKMLLDIMTK